MSPSSPPAILGGAPPRLAQLVLELLLVPAAARASPRDFLRAQMRAQSLAADRFGVREQVLFGRRPTTARRSGGRDARELAEQRVAPAEPLEVLERHERHGDLRVDQLLPARNVRQLLDRGSAAASSPPTWVMSTDGLSAPSRHQAQRVVHVVGVASGRPDKVVAGVVDVVEVDVGAEASCPTVRRRS